MNTLRKIIFFFLMLCITNTLVACGRYSEPSPIEGSGYPHNYPHH